MRPPCEICGSNDHSAPECSAPTPSPESDDDEFGPPETIQVDPNAQVNHMVKYLTDELAKAAWRVGQHAAEVDALKRRLAHTISERDAWRQMAEDARKLLYKVEGSSSAGQPVPPELPPDVFLEASAPATESATTPQQ